MKLGLAVVAAVVALSGDARAGSSAGPDAPSATATVTARPRVLALSVKEAIVRALRNNPDVSVAQLQVAFAQAGIGAPAGLFDPALFGGASYARRRDPFFALDPFNGALGGVNPITGLPSGLAVNPADIGKYDAGFRQLTPLGTSYEVRYDQTRQTSASKFALSPQWTASAQVTVTQPLLKGFGLAVNRAYVTIAQRQAEQTREQFLDAAMTTAFTVEQAYWGHVYAVENRKVAEQALRTAKDLVEINKKKLEVGRLAPIEVLVAETGVANRQDAVIQTRAAALDTRDQLLRLIEPPGSSSAWDVDLLALDSPRASDADAIDPERALELALQKRPDLRGLNRAIEADRARVLRTHDDTLPRVNLFGSFSENGLGSSHHNSNSGLVSGDFYDWAVGVDIEVPLFNQSAQAAAMQAEIALRQDRKRVESLELGIALDVRIAVRDLLAARERIRATDKAAELSGRQVEEQRKRLVLGIVTNYEVLLVEQDLTQALVNAVKAKTDHAVALARLARVTGRSLERHEIRVEEAE